jgi:hypothetical protein
MIGTKHMINSGLVKLLQLLFLHYNKNITNDNASKIKRKT